MNLSGSFTGSRKSFILRQTQDSPAISQSKGEKQNGEAQQQATRLYSSRGTESNITSRPPVPNQLKKANTRIYDGYVRNMRKIPISNSKKKLRGSTARNLSSGKKGKTLKIDGKHSGDEELKYEQNMAKYATEANETGMGHRESAVSLTKKLEEDEFIMADSDTDFELYEIPNQNFQNQEQNATATTMITSANDLSSNPVGGKTISIKSLLINKKNEGLVKHSSFVKQEEDHSSVNMEKENTYNFVVNNNKQNQLDENLFKKPAKLNTIKRPLTAVNYKPMFEKLQKDDDALIQIDETKVKNEGEKMKNDVEDLIDKIQRKKRIASAKNRPSVSNAPTFDNQTSPVNVIDSDKHIKFLSEKRNTIEPLSRNPFGDEAFDPEKKGLEEITNKFLQQRGKELGVNVGNIASPRKSAKEEINSNGFRVQSNRLGSAKTQRIPFAQNIIFEIREEPKLPVHSNIAERELKLNKINLLGPNASSKPMRAFSSKPHANRPEVEIKSNNYAIVPDSNAIRPLSKKTTTGSFSNLQKSLQNLEHYTIGPILGTGSYAAVKLGIDKSNNHKVAIKIYDKFKLLDPQKKKNVQREISILEKMNHNNIIKLVETIENSKTINLVLEYVGTSSLHSYLKARPDRRLEESEVKRLFKQVVDATAYLHRRNIAHRDIKLENILLDDKKNIKLIDFGFSICMPADKKLCIFCGTPTYMAPEIVSKKEYHGDAVDTWALGILLYVMLCGKFPFKGKDDKDLYSKIKRGAYDTPAHLSVGAKYLLSKILKVCPSERIESNMVTLLHRT